MLPKQFNPKNKETQIYQLWEDADAFEPRNDPHAENFSIVIPPPNVTGSLHIGHAFNNCLQDILVRYQRLLGKNVLWQPGTDHAGIATQMVVERQLAENGEPSRKDLGRDAFLERVWHWKKSSGGQIFKQLRRLGASAAWNRERFTLDPGSMSDAVTKVFVDLHQQDLLYRDKRMVNWDTKFQTAISDLEVENVEVDGHFYHIRYPLSDSDGDIVIATTRPETLLGDVAVAVHPKDERYTDLIGKMIALPLTNVKIPIITDHHADPEQGSGAVKITPAHDFNDHEVGRRHALPNIDIFDDKGYLKSETDHAGDDVLERIPADLYGVERFEARKIIVEKLRDAGLLVEVEAKKIIQPFGDRSKTVIEPRLTDQWFIKAKTLAKPAIEAVENGGTKFYPTNWTKTYYNWMNDIQPWCVSRQLWWGHQIPAWYGPQNMIFVAKDESEAIDQAKSKWNKNIVVVDRMTAIEQAFTNEKGDILLYRDEDVLDTWFSSALWPFSTQGWPEHTKDLAQFYPSTVLITAFDILFFWVARMMMQGLHFMQDVPFKHVYIHALVRDEHGQKMSKSKGNVIDPLDLIDRYGADAVRFTLAVLAVQGRDVNISENRIKGYRNFGTKLWNVARFCEMNACGLKNELDVAKIQLAQNIWLLDRANAALEQLERDFTEYKFNDAANNIYHFVWDEFCDWAIELSKPLLDEKDSAGAQEVRDVLGHVLYRILIMLHPFMPFVTEELWQLLAKESNRTDKNEDSGLLINAGWPDQKDISTAQKLKKISIDRLITMIKTVRSLRSDLKIPAGEKIDLLISGKDKTILNEIEDSKDLLRRLARCNDIQCVDQIPETANQTIVDQVIIGISPPNMTQNIDDEIERLSEEISRLDNEIARLDKKLNNPQFVERAPSEIVEKEKSKRTSYMSERAEIQKRIERIT